MYIITWDSGITRPEDKGILLKDIIEKELDKKFILTDGELNYMKNGNDKWQQAGDCRLERYAMNPDEKAFTVTANISKGVPYNCIEIQGGAMRGRNPENPSDRQVGLLTEQRLEINETGKANCLTSVSKDSLCIQVGVADIKGNESIKRIYSEEGKSPCLTTMGGGNREPKIAVPGFENKKSEKILKRISDNICDLNGKGNCILATQYKGAANNGATAISDNNISWRKLTPLECERLQTVDDNYTLVLDSNGRQVVSNSQRYRMLGNGFTVDVVAHIFSYMKKDMEEQEKKSA